MIILDFWCAFHSEDHFKNMWLGWARSSMEGLGTFLEYGISSGIIECFHLYAIEMLAFLAAYQNNQSDFATQVVIMNMYSFVYMIAQGYSYAASALVGFHLAENKTKTASPPLSFCKGCLRLHVLSGKWSY